MQQFPELANNDDDDIDNDCASACSWFMNQIWANKETIATMSALVIGLIMLQQVPTAAATQNNEQKFEQPYCHDDGRCYVREGRVEGNVVRYQYNERINNFANPNFLADPRFQGQPPVMHQDPHRLAHNPNALFNHPAQRLENMAGANIRNRHLGDNAANANDPNRPRFRN